MVRSWELTEGQKVYGLWMRRARETPGYSEDRFYPVHPSCYTMEATQVINLTTVPCPDYYKLEWWAYLTGRAMPMVVDAGHWGVLYA